MPQSCRFRRPFAVGRDRLGVRIVQMANYYSPQSGGVRTALDNLARGYVDAGVQRLLIVPGPVDARFTTEVGDVVQIRAPKVSEAYRLIIEPWRILAILSAYAPTSIEVSDKFTMVPVAWWARSKGIGTALFSHERMDEYMLNVTGKETTTALTVALLNRILVRSFDAVVVTSKFAEREFRRLAASVDCPTMRVPLGVDLDRFHPRWREASADIPDGVLRLALVGRLSREKAPHLAVETAMELHRRGVPVELDVYGDGPQRDELEAIASDGPVRFDGYIGDRGELARRIASADIALSVCPSETFGLAVLEALASGTPVVTADRGGARELIDQASGAWAAPNPEALADAVLRIAARAEGERRAGARARAEQFPWSRTVQSMLDIHGSLSAGQLALA